MENFWKASNEITASMLCYKLYGNNYFVNIIGYKQQLDGGLQAGGRAGGTLK